MNCEAFRAHLFAYVERHLDDGNRAAVEDHAGGCEACGDLFQRIRELTCRQFVDFLQDYLDGELLPEQSRVFRRHLECCPPCMDYLDAYEKTVALGKEVCRSDGTFPGGVPEQLIRAVLDAQRGAQ